MGIYKHILFATDLSKLGNTIAPKVKKIAELHKAKISLITVLEQTAIYGYPGVGEVENSINEKTQNAMTEFSDKIQVPKERQYIEFGSVKKQVLSCAKSINADLIIAGSHGHHGVSRFLGSSANAIVNNAKCDVLLIRAED